MQTFAQGAGWLQPLALDEFDLVTLAGLAALRGDPATAARELQIDFIDRMLHAWLAAKAGQDVVAVSGMYSLSRSNQPGSPASIESPIVNNLRRQIPSAKEDNSLPVDDSVRQSMYFVAQSVSNHNVNNSSQVQMLQLKDIENHITASRDSFKRPRPQIYPRNDMPNRCLLLANSSVESRVSGTDNTKRTSRTTSSSAFQQKSTYENSKQFFHEPECISNLPRPYDLPPPPMFWHSSSDKHSVDSPRSNSTSLSTIPEVTFDAETIPEVDETCIMRRVTRTVHTNTQSHTNRKCIYSDRKSNPFARRSSFNSKNNNYTNFKHI